MHIQSISESCSIVELFKTRICFLANLLVAMAREILIETNKPSGILQVII